MHGMSKHYLYATYIAMRQRCESETNRAYPDYGGRGITICDRWRDGDGGISGFECFLSDMGDRPEGMSIDRIDANLGYEPSNCRWATYKTQGGNRRNPARNRHINLLIDAVDAHLELQNDDTLSALRWARTEFAATSQKYRPANDNNKAKAA